MNTEREFVNPRYKPPYTLTPAILHLVADIIEEHFNDEEDGFAKIVTSALAKLRVPLLVSN